MAAKNRQWRWRIEAALVRGLLALSRRIGILRASALGGSVCRRIGPLLPVSNIARRNLQIAFPDSTADWQEEVLRGAWENLGRTMMELSHLRELQRTESGPGWELEGVEHIPPPGRPVIFFSAHLANWEILLRPSASTGHTVATFYRAPDNPLVDLLVRELRQDSMTLSLFPKGSRGARLALKHLAAGHCMGILVDQKMNDGLELPFFGHPAMTATGPAELALRFGCPVVPIHGERIGPCRFRLVIEKPLPAPEGNDHAAKVRSLTLMMNQAVEGWLRRRPQEWLWMHRRFPRSAYRS
ncbi:lysophospholipid acyltransferase family protein [Teichococcus vastitatis]|uniref:Lauroyl acyltransferase n=1 Tax=Teichococcus vastitatis TaxID=2307076 RepID=A0ABS9W3V9_9PROT|nr:lauroyl acyltransferase [Pseudoroseomonas vastitatis]MCI0753917.1 lauroyl acyltransferase [Pseudoroseomonas vastitatis]